ncbi:MAG: transcription termination factor Rho [Ilumatobacteraceae bacterium]|nr:transcription termination factor Rho [Ilumatobacteraceae bacterium]
MAADALEQSVLESKDREQLMAIANALGVKSTSRAKKADLIQKILETTGAIPSSGGDSAPEPQTSGATPALFDAGSTSPTASAPVLGPDGEPLADWEIELLEQGISTDTTPTTTQVGSSGNAQAPRSTSPAPRVDGRPAPAPVDADGDADGDEGDDDGGDGEGGSDGIDGDGESRNRRRRRRRNKNRAEVGPDGERIEAPRPAGQPNVAPAPHGNQGNGNPGNGNQGNGNGNQGGGQNGPRNDRGDRNEPAEAGYGQDPVEVSGYLDLRDEGYGFLRVSGYLPSRDDSYIPVKLTRQFGLRKGDHVTGLSRPAGRNEKNPALLEVHTVNGGDPDAARSRPRFEDLTAVSPDSILRLENPADPGTNPTACRIIDLISPIGLGQRALIVSPPKAGKTTIIKTIASAIERNHPDVKLIVLLIDERPEEVTDMRRTVSGEVLASTFDRPSDEHTQLAEMCIDKAKRLVEQGDDVVVILDGLTRLTHAYNAVAPSTGRTLAGGLDAGALLAPKRLFAAARKVEEGGSLTILATVLVGTGNPADDAIVEELTGAANAELHLDRHLAERRLYPAIDVIASSTRHEELLIPSTQLQQVWALRRILADAAADGNPAAGLELLTGRLGSTKDNDALLGSL